MKNFVPYLYYLHSMIALFAITIDGMELQAPMSERTAKFFVGSMALYQKTAIERNFHPSLRNTLARINTILQPRQNDCSFHQRAERIFQDPDVNHRIVPLLVDHYFRDPEARLFIVVAAQKMAQIPQLTPDLAALFSLHPNMPVVNSEEFIAHQYCTYQALGQGADHYSPVPQSGACR